MSAVRADVSPHLDGADISIVLQHRGKANVNARVEVQLWPAQVNPSNRLDPESASLIQADAKPLLDNHISLDEISGDSVFRVPVPFSIRSTDHLLPRLPALHALKVTASENDD